MRGSVLNIAMWSGPRNLSTAMMYSFGARQDCAVWDEPFYAAYLGLNEAEKHGFKQALIPMANKPKEALAKMDVQTVSHISQVLDKVSL